VYLSRDLEVSHAITDRLTLLLSSLDQLLSDLSVASSSGLGESSASSLELAVLESLLAGFVLTLGFALFLAIIFKFGLDKILQKSIFSKSDSIELSVR
jgi:hypothetical protein